MIILKECIEKRNLMESFIEEAKKHNIVLTRCKVDNEYGILADSSFGEILSIFKIKAVQQDNILELDQNGYKALVPYENNVAILSVAVNKEDVEGFKDALMGRLLNFLESATNEHINKEKAQPHLNINFNNPIEEFIKNKRKKEKVQEKVKENIEVNDLSKMSIYELNDLIYKIEEEMNRRETTCPNCGANLDNDKAIYEKTFYRYKINPKTGKPCFDPDMESVETYHCSKCDEKIFEER